MGALIYFFLRKSGQLLLWNIYVFEFSDNFNYNIIESLKYEKY